MVPSSKTPLCDVIYVYCKALLPAAKNKGEIDRSLHAYGMSTKQKQAPDDEIYEGLNTMCNDIGCTLKF